jgi:hypothetical protein
VIAPVSSPAKAAKVLLLFAVSDLSHSTARHLFFSAIDFETVNSAAGRAAAKGDFQ